ncbi:hypothetical protein Cgig2_020367 [Carnegiea gigantea]|uniref:Uncharacterized protein n=1 Tax=Carnegiea gigantea TaxID=171969 RepID=A0A9Q1QGW4_9CARY|nr:hypothetical protein Cgig2_020367 [Carnegiea gigantea]
MSNLRANSRIKKQTTLTNECENERISRIRENKLKLQSLGIKHIATSLISLVDDTNAKRAKGKQKSQMDNDVEYVPCCNDADEELNSSGNELREQEQDHAIIQIHLPLFLWTSEINEQLFAENIYGDTHGFLDKQEFSDDDYDNKVEQNKLWKLRTYHLGIKQEAMNKEDPSIQLVDVMRNY